MALIHIVGMLIAIYNQSRLIAVLRQYFRNNTFPEEVRNGYEKETVKNHKESQSLSGLQKRNVQMQLQIRMF